MCHNSRHISLKYMECFSWNPILFESVCLLFGKRGDYRKLLQVLSVKKRKKKEKMHFYGVTDNFVKCKCQELGLQNVSFQLTCSK